MIAFISNMKKNTKFRFNKNANGALGLNGVIRNLRRLLFKMSENGN